MKPICITPQWPAPKNVFAAMSTRLGGCSQTPFAAMNVGMHCGDDAQAVQHNRQQLSELLALPQEPFWLQQTHSVRVTHAGTDNNADGAYTAEPKQICVVMSADCLPILMCSKDGIEVAAIHAGWRGLAAGIISNGLAQFSCAAADVLVWLGPCIGPSAFEVGADVKAAFCAAQAQAEQAFRQTASDRWHADLHLLAQQQLQSLGVEKIYADPSCTWTDAERFYSYRRDGQTGRMASMIWRL